MKWTNFGYGISSLAIAVSMVACTGHPVRASNPLFFKEDAIGFSAEEMERDLERSSVHSIYYKVEAVLLTKALQRARAREIAKRTLIPQTPRFNEGMTCFEFILSTTQAEIDRFRYVAAMAEDGRGATFPIGFLAAETGTDPNPYPVTSPLDGYHWRNRAVGCAQGLVDLSTGVAVHFTPIWKGAPRSTLVWRLTKPTIETVFPIDN